MLSILIEGYDYNSFVDLIEEKNFDPAAKYQKPNTKLVADSLTLLRAKRLCSNIDLLPHIMGTLEMSGDTQETFDAKVKQYFYTLTMILYCLDHDMPYDTDYKPLLHAYGGYGNKYWIISFDFEEPLKKNLKAYHDQLKDVKKEIVPPVVSGYVRELDSLTDTEMKLEPAVIPIIGQYFKTTLPLIFLTAFAKHIVRSELRQK
jgi:hypothetical protein